MLVFIDESGCAGFKVNKGSSPYFVVAMVVFDCDEEAQIVDREIDQIRTSSGHKPEFKFSKCRYDVRDEFCTSVVNFEFVIRAIVVDKSKIYSPALKSSTESFYNYFVKTMMQYDDELLVNANVKIDGSGDRRFRTELQKYLRTQVGGNRIKKVRFVDSRSSNLIQLADMAAGAIHRCYRSDRKDSDRWRKQLNKRIGDIWVFPSN